MERVDLWIRPVNQLLGEVTPFHQQHVDLQRQTFMIRKTDKRQHFVTHALCVCISVEAYVVLTREESFFKSQ